MGNLLFTTEEAEHMREKVIESHITNSRQLAVYGAVQILRRVTLGQEGLADAGTREPEPSFNV
jgi:hypothetical protein